MYSSMKRAWPSTGKLRRIECRRCRKSYPPTASRNTRGTAANSHQAETAAEAATEAIASTSNTGIINTPMAGNGS